MQKVREQHINYIQEWEDNIIYDSEGLILF